MNSIFKRTSVRNFQSKPVEDEKIVTLLKAAMAAPSAGNQQPWEFYVVTDPAILKQLAASSPYAGCSANAPAAIVPVYRTFVMFPENAEMDLSAAVENILLEAVELDLGAVWLGIAPLEERMDKVKEILNLPEGIVPFCIIPIGYPAQAAPQHDRYDQTRVHFIK